MIGHRQHLPRPLRTAGRCVTFQAKKTISSQELGSFGADRRDTKVKDSSLAVSLGLAAIDRETSALYCHSDPGADPHRRRIVFPERMTLTQRRY